MSEYKGNKSEEMESAFRHLDRVSVRRERHRRLRSGMILPARLMRPHILEKNSEGEWKIVIPNYGVKAA